MHRPLAWISTAALIVAAVLVVGAGLLLRHGTRIPVEGRDAFAARVERGDRPMAPREIAAHWRSELATRQSLLERDRLLSRILLGTGALVLLAGAGHGAAARRQAQRRVETTAA